VYLAPVPKSLESAGRSMMATVQRGRPQDQFDATLICYRAPGEAIEVSRIGRAGYCLAVVRRLLGSDAAGVLAYITEH
jgi:hypothetical protein